MRSRNGGKIQRPIGARIKQHARPRAERGESMAFAARFRDNYRDVALE
jgi:hypothetical protein